MKTNHSPRLTKTTEAYLLQLSRFNPTMSEADADIRRVLTIVFRGCSEINLLDLERFLSFDMEWVAPHEAEEAVKKLTAKGWLVNQQQVVKLAVELGDVDVPLGWFPRPSRILSPPPATGVEEKKSASSKGTVESVVSSPESKSFAEENHDPRTRLTKRLVRFISRNSGLETSELERRAQRKVAAFHHITPWLAYALVAREQGLAMNDIADALAVI